MFLHSLTFATVSLLMATSILTKEAAMANQLRVRSIEINDHILAGGGAIVHLSTRSPHYAVETINGKYVVVVKY